MRVFLNHVAVLWPDILRHPSSTSDTNGQGKKTISLGSCGDAVCCRYVGRVIVSFAQCKPVSAYWGPDAKKHCCDPVVQQYTGFFFKGVSHAPGGWKFILNVSSCLLYGGSYPCSPSGTFVLEASNENTNQDISIDINGPRYFVSIKNHEFCDYIDLFFVAPWSSLSLKRLSCRQ